MTARRFSGAYKLILTVSFALPLVCGLAPARADDASGSPDAASGDIVNAKFQFIGRVNGPSVFVRAGASDVDYPVMKLDSGAQVTVVGERFGWLKIMPPDGSFCYVAKAYVEKHGDGTQGRVVNTLNARVGSSLNDMKAVIATKLEPGTDVQIIGEADEYFKIKPPEGTYLYVKKEFIEPVQRIAKPADAPSGDNSAANAAPANADNSTASAAGPTTNPADGSTVAMTPTTQPALAMDEPTTQPSAGPTTTPTDKTLADDEASFDQLQQRYAAESGKTLDQQDPASLLAGYQKIASDRVLPESLLQTTDERVTVLKARVTDREQFVAVQKEQQEAKARLTALQAERQELQDRVAKTDVKFYTAVGTLRPSSLQQGTMPLYRLTDPVTGRTVVYIKSDDVKLGSMSGQFIGVKGDVIDDPQLSLKVITPTDYEPVDQSKLYNGIAAQMVPPSLMPSGQASIASP